MKKFIFLFLISFMFIGIFSFNVAAEGEDLNTNSPTEITEDNDDVEQTVNFVVKAYNPINEELTLGNIDSYRGDEINVKVFDLDNKQLDINLFDFEVTSAIYKISKNVNGTTYPYFITNKAGANQTITAILKEDQSKKASVTFNCVESDRNISFVMNSYNELWYVTKQNYIKGDEHFYLDYNDAYDSDFLQKSSKTGNVIESVEIICHYGNYSHNLMEVANRPNIEEYKLISSDTNVVKTYIDALYENSDKEWIIEIVGNGTADITAVLTDNEAVTTTMTISVKNYPTKESKQATTTTNNNQKSNIDTNNEIKIDSSNGSIVVDSDINKEELVEEVSFEEKEWAINMWYVIIPAILTISMWVLFFVLKNKLFMYFGIAFAAVYVMGMVLFFVFNEPTFNYNEALSLYKNGNYIEALSVLGESDENLAEECKYRLLIDEILNNDKEEASNVYANDNDIKTFVDGYVNSDDLFNKYKNLDSLRQEIIRHTSYKYGELYFLEKSIFDDYIKNEISSKSVGDTFMLKNYSFKVIEKTNDSIYAIADICFFKQSIEDDSWKQKVLNCFNGIEKEIISENDLILLSREDYKNYVSHITVSNYSWWLDDISRVTRTDTNGIVHRLRYYAIGRDSSSERGTSMIDDTQEIGSYSYSYIDNDSIWIRPVIRISY